jgi:hypothetical protein
VTPAPAPRAVEPASKSAGKRSLPRELEPPGRARGLFYFVHDLAEPITPQSDEVPQCCRTAFWTVTLAN